jgi:hypothetical protein
LLYCIALENQGLGVHAHNKNMKTDLSEERCQTTYVKCYKLKLKW